MSADTATWLNNSNLTVLLMCLACSGGHPRRVAGCRPWLRLRLPRPPRRHVDTLPARADVLLRHDTYRTNTEPLLEGPRLGRFEVADPATSMAVRSGASSGHFRRHQLQHPRVHIRRRSGCHHLRRRTGEMFFFSVSLQTCLCLRYPINQ